MFLEIRGIRKSFGEGDSLVEVLKGIDLSVEKGEFCVLLGPLSFQFAVNKNTSVLSYSPLLSFIRFDCGAFILEHPITADFQ